MKEVKENDQGRGGGGPVVELLGTEGGPPHSVLHFTLVGGVHTVM